jgi:universal stress protein A
MDRLKVLVPVDFSEPSRRALAWAFDYATRAPCEMHVLHVVEDHLSDLFPAAARERIDSEIAAVTLEAEEELARMIPDVAERREVEPLHRHVARGRPVSEILRVAEKIGAEMIVVGSHGRSGLAELLLGSVAEAVVRRAVCPVVCVKGAA